MRLGHGWMTTYSLAPKRERVTLDCASVLVRRCTLRLGERACIDTTPLRRRRDSRREPPQRRRRRAVFEANLRASVQRHPRSLRTATERAAVSRCCHWSTVRRFTTPNRLLLRATRARTLARGRWIGCRAA